VKYNDIANSHTLQFNTASTKSFLSVVFTSRCLVTASRADVALPLGSRTTPVPQLPASHSNSSLPPNSNTLLTAHQFTLLHCTQLNYVVAPLIVLLILRHGPHRKHRSCCTQCWVRSHRRGPHRKHLLSASPLARVRNLLPSNVRCLQSLLSNGSTSYTTLK
jgi:uncharacterized paraquat-inducible protein A